MTRSLSATAIAAANAVNNNTAIICLLVIEHPLLSTLRLARDMKDVTHLGNIYKAFPFDINLLDEMRNELPGTTLVLNYVDKSVVDLVLAVNSKPATVTIKYVLASNWDQVEWEITPALLCKKAVCKSMSASFDLGLRSLINEEVPVHKKTGNKYPGLRHNR